MDGADAIVLLCLESIHMRVLKIIMFISYLALAIGSLYNDRMDLTQKIILWGISGAAIFASSIGLIIPKVFDWCYPSLNDNVL